MILYCVGHGESVYNAEKRFQVRANPPLSERGQQQSTLVANALSSLGIQAVYSSPLQRALDTADAVANAVKLKPVVSVGLIDGDQGIFQGKIWPEVLREYPDEAACYMQ